MKFLGTEEAKIVRAFLKIHIPDYIREYRDEQFDLMDCYEIGFTYANDLLRGRKIDPDASPWGDGQSVIFDPNYVKLLLNILNCNVDTAVSNYCHIFLDVLDVFKLHFKTE